MEGQPLSACVLSTAASAPQGQSGVAAAEVANLLHDPLQKEFNFCFKPLSFVLISYTAIDKQLSSKSRDKILQMEYLRNTS